METKETFSRTDKETLMLENNEYYKYIFKKTEKIVCAVFYILRSSSYNGQNDRVIADLESTTETLLSVSLESLRGTSRSIEADANNLRHALVRLESKLRLTHAARLLETVHLEVFLHEIDSLQRSLKKYTEQAPTNPFADDGRPFELVRERKPLRSRNEAVLGSIAGSAVQGPSRRERILNVLRDKVEASIKDITGTITDCSEKTIQRELIGLIKDNIVLREGERRWSKYKLV